MVDLLAMLRKRAPDSLPGDPGARILPPPPGVRHGKDLGSPAWDILAAARPKRASDTERIVALPRVTDATYADAMAHALRLRIPGGELRLRPVQAHALAVIGTCRGLLGAIGVGHGKTLISILGAVMVGARRPIVMLPPSLRDTFRAEYMKFQFAFVLPEIEIVPYSMLSRPEGTDLLRRLAPDYIFADEAHALRHPTSARTRRLLRYLEESPETVFCAASGTLTARSIRDYAHLARHALKTSSPLPLLASHLDSWANVLDVDGRPSATDWKTIAPLVEAFSDSFGGAFHRGKARRDNARSAFRERFRSAPGVVTTTDESAPCSLLIHALASPSPPADVLVALDKARSGESPDGAEVYEDDVAVWRARRQLSAGFFYRWAWEQTPRGVVDHEWLEARARWSRHVRRQLEVRACEGFDSPALVARSVAANIERTPELAHVSAIHAAWTAWTAVRDRPVPPTVPVWISAYLVDAVVAQVAELAPRPVLVWYETRALGEAIAAALAAELCGPGNPPAGEPRTLVVSIAAHHKGLNLQAWSASLVAEPPSSGQTWEQLIGRTHRAGQTADEVDVFVFVGPEPFTRAFEAARERAAYQAATTGGKHKLVYAPVITH